MKADKAKALDMFNKGEGGFLTATFTYLLAGSISATAKPLRVATPTAGKCFGTDTRTIKDATGKVSWRGTLCVAYQKPEGQITEDHLYVSKTAAPTLRRFRR